LTSVEREMFLQVEQDLFLGSTTQVNCSATHVHRDPLPRCGLPRCNLPSS
jgi:hypothetical protein